MPSTSDSEPDVPDRKRPRIDQGEHEEKVFVRHPYLYLEDGNIILSAGRTLFRVHRSILSKHSPVMGELFERKHDTLHGCVHIPLEHTSQELEAFIDVIYNGW